MEMKGRQFYTIEVMEAESKAVLNPYTTSRMHLKNGSGTGTVYMHGRGLLRG
jgi:hypothetical protein